MAVATLFLAVAALAGYSVVDAREARVPGGGASVAQPNLTDTRPVVVVIGDSFADGSDMNTGPTWPYRLAEKRKWLYYPEAVGGTGFINKGQTESFTKRLPAILDEYGDPDMIIVAGGRNDIDKYPTAQIAAAAAAMLDELYAKFPKTRIELFSPFASGPPTESIEALTAALRDVAAAHHAEYLDVSNFLTADLIGEDGVHPTDAGHKALTRQIDQGLGPL